MKNPNLFAALILLTSMIISSCSVVGGIFKTGMGVGIFIVIVVVIIIIAVVARGKK